MSDRSFSNSNGPGAGNSTWNGAQDSPATVTITGARLGGKSYGAYPEMA